VGHRTGLDSLEKRSISYLYQQSNQGSSNVQPVALSVCQLSSKFLSIGAILKSALFWDITHRCRRPHLSVG